MGGVWIFSGTAQSTPYNLGVLQPPQLQSPGSGCVDMCRELENSL